MRKLATFLTLGLMTLALPSITEAQFCASALITDQEIVPEPGGAAAICTLQLCWVPPDQANYPYDGTNISGHLQGGAALSIVSATAPAGWTTYVSPLHSVIWEGPHMNDTVCGFSITVRVPQPLTGFCFAHSFALDYDVACSDQFCVETGTVGVAPRTWGRVKSQYR